MKISPSVRKFVLFLILVAAILLGRSWYFSPKLSPAQRSPSFEAATENGETFNLSDERGKYVYLNFWGSWCGPCLAKLPDLRRLHQSLPGHRFRLVNVAVEDDRERYRRALQHHKIPGTHLLDPSNSLRFFNGPIAQKFGVKQLPTSFLIGPDGMILAYNPSVEEVVMELDVD